MNIKVELKTNISDGSEVVFRSPADCSQVTGLVIYHTGGKTEFAFADAHGHNVGDIDHLFAENAVVKVILDVTAGMAFVQNADTNAYIERTFVKTVNGAMPDSDGNVEIEVSVKGSGIYIGSGEMPEGYNVQIDPEGEILDLASLMTEGDVEQAIEDALEDFEPPESGGGIEVSGAKVGQFLKVAEVDENGVPTAWETAEMPTGGSNGFRLIRDITIPEDVATDTSDVTFYEASDGVGLNFGFTTDENGNSFAVNELFIYCEAKNSAEGTGTREVYLLKMNTSASNQYYYATSMHTGCVEASEHQSAMCAKCHIIVTAGGPFGWAVTGQSGTAATKTRQFGSYIRSPFTSVRLMATQPSGNSTGCGFLSGSKFKIYGR